MAYNQDKRNTRGLGRDTAQGDYRKRSYENKGHGDRPYGEKTYGDRDRERKPFDRRNADRPFEKKPYTKREEKPVKRIQEEDVQTQQQDELPFLVFGRNAVREAIRSGRSIDKILVNEEQDGSLREILEGARERKLVIRTVDRRKLDEVCMPFGHGGKSANHQGIVAYTAGVEYCQLQDILEAAKEKGEEPFVIVLDGIEDPHNLGSIIRSADCAGAHGVIIGKRRSASVTAAAVKASAGAAEHVKIARVVNIPLAIESLKKAGLWIAGADMGGKNMYNMPMQGALALVIGNEGEGLSRLVREKCDFILSIPMNGHVDSLNAGVAAGILMFEKRRQDKLQAQETNA